MYGIGMNTVFPRVEKCELANQKGPRFLINFAPTATRPDIAVAVMRLLFQSDHRAELSRLEIPTLILQSSHDIAVPRQVGEYLTQKIPNATLRMLDARGHLPHMSVPDAVLDAISSFLF